jgi:hypothetical protein
MKRFDKGGLAFDYPSGWNLVDESKTDAQNLTLSHEGSTAQIKISVPGTLIDTPEKMAQARTKVIEPFIEAVAQLLVELGGKPEKSAASATIGGAQAEGVRIRAVLRDEPGEATVYWRIAGNRLVILVFFGSDQSLKQASAAWDAVRISLRVREN